MKIIAASLPEYRIAREIAVLEDRTGPRLLAEIGAVRCFRTLKALVSYAGLIYPYIKLANLRKVLYEIDQSLKNSKIFKR